MGLFQNNEYWIYNTAPDALSSKRPKRPPSMVCAGHFKEKGYYHFGPNKDEMTSHQPQPRSNSKVSPFRSAALCDKFAAIGTHDQILVFTSTGLWLLCHKERDNNTSITHLKFSPDGKELLALVRTKSDSGMCQRALIVAVAEFPNEPELEEKSWFKEVGMWENSVYTPRGLAFSSDGEKIAIYTNCPGDGTCQIRFLQRCNEWRKRGEHTISVRGQGQSSGRLTGIQLYTLLKFD